MQDELRLASVIRRWLVEKEWDDEVRIDHVEQTSQVATGISSDDHQFKVYIESEEKKEWLSVFLYSLLTVPENRVPECLLLINQVNMRIGVGRFALTSERTIQFKAVADCEGAEITPMVLENMYASGKGGFFYWIDAFGKVVFTELAATQIIQDIDKAHNEKNQVRH